MSFILDALKKSESDRQRQNGPALYEVKVAAPRAQLPLWAIGLAVLLAINLAIVAWALLRRPSHAGTAEQPTTQAPVYAQTPPPAAVSGGVGAGGGGNGGNATVQAAPAPAPVAAQGAQFAQGAAPAPASPNMAAPLPQSPVAAVPGAATAAAGGGSTAPAVNPDDYAPATDPGRPSDGFHIRRATESGVPLYADAAAQTNGMPELRLDLHAYAPKPQDRFVLINMKRLREGETVAAGIRVESITPDGVVVSRNGTNYLIPRQ